MIWGMRECGGGRWGSEEGAARKGSGDDVGRGRKVG